MRNGRYGSEKEKFAPHPMLTRYNQIPKHFVEPELADELFFISTKLAREKPYPSYLFVAGSAAAESGLVATNISPEERHSRVHIAEQLWSQAQQRYIELHCNDGWTESKVTAFTDRIQAHRIFVPLFHDLINGCVEERTSEVLHERLVRLANRNLDLYLSSFDAHDYGGASGRKGLSAELGVIGSITRLNCPTYFAMPTTARGDDGTYFGDKVHDVQVISQSWGSIRSATPIEVKQSGLYRRGDRYSSTYVSGRVHLNMPSSESPHFLCRYLKKELQGTATPQEISELNDVTSNVLRETINKPRYTYQLGRLATD